MTNPNLRDTDGDGIIDGVETLFLGTVATSKDSDKDGCDDNSEMASVNADRRVRVDDITAVSNQYGSSIGDSKYIKSFDMDGDGKILIADVLFVVNNYYKDCPN